MKSLLYPQSLILLIAALFAFAITVYLGTFVSDSTVFYNNTFWVNVTFMGDAFFAFGLFVFLLFYFNKKKLAFNFIVTIFFTLVFVQIIKNIFGGTHIQLYFEEGVLNEGKNSLFYRNFISSHTAVAFTLAIFFAKYFKKYVLTVLLFVIAILVSYSRMIIAEESLLALCVGLLPALCSIVLINYLMVTKESNKGYFYKPRKLSRGNLKTSNSFS